MYFAELSTGSKEKAEQLQARMAERLLETDFMPKIDQLPEAIMELEFKRIYREVDSAQYQMVEDEINQRIARCRIYQLNAYTDSN